ncbi:manganese-dependent inorganic pyrophosphatase [Vibrio sp. SCSIO 43136]|uniref:manganese-dependent inorganic pyrophosphatase n=1 Tax=Vibrio sp. SCSIO 43136 TaxID=2819101 RepID=UPI002075B11B|nr:manganese-dependent inorganic pyrophosphatase [Vibrio sp. SCSIO 43136]USD68005.1 manganese-dependent inorganic pyrophosphatase [Vibrio sp. SCSIO 43136]
MNKTLLISSLSFLAAPTMAFDLGDPSQNDTTNLVWTGHISPDTDTVTSAIIAAHIYGGVAVVPEQINPESKFVLEYCNYQAPEVMPDFSGKQVGLVDFNQKTQLQATIDESSIVTIIDHHAIGGKPVNMAQVATLDIRPWGSAATILADRAEQIGVKLPKEIACTTLGGILSDTVVLQSSTTTKYDHQYAQSLAKTAGIKDINDFGQQMLVAKSDLSHMSAETILTMDYKNFEFAGKKVGIGVAETLTAEQLLARKQEFIEAMKAHKADKQLDHLFFSVTDTKNKQANLIWIDAQDGEVAKQAFDQDKANQWLNLPGVTSRKRQIAPAIQSAIESIN